MIPHAHVHAHGKTMHADGKAQHGLPSWSFSKRTCTCERHFAVTDSRINTQSTRSRHSPLPAARLRTRRDPRASATIPPGTCATQGGR
eukprot:366378-Chlamydomonas_euryale.AAC.14